MSFIMKINPMNLISIFEMVLGLASGIMIGAGFLSLLIVLGVIQRLIQLSGTKNLVNFFGGAVILGVLFGTYLSFTDTVWKTSSSLLVVLGLIQGIFNGMVAAALTEILNVFPLLSKRIGMQQYIYWLLMAVVFGKISGSLFQWLFLVK